MYYRKSIAMHNHEVETSCLLLEPISWEKVHYKLVIKVKSLVTKLTIAAQFTIKQFVVKGILMFWRQWITCFPPLLESNYWWVIFKQRPVRENPQSKMSITNHDEGKTFSCWVVVNTVLVTQQGNRFFQ